ncbi:43431_t:CDS:2, partial [Gigaspora margarita]
LDDFVSETDVGLLSTAEATDIINNVTPEQLHKAMIEVAKNPPKEEDLQDAFNRDILNLIEKHKSVENSFKQIYAELCSIDEYEGGKTTWAEEWKELWLSFTSLVTESKKQAGILSTYAKRNVEVILPFLASKNNSDDEKRNLLKKTIENVNEKQKEAEVVSIKFKEYEPKFIKFDTAFGDWAKKKQSDDIEPAIKNIESDIKATQDKIKILDGQILGLVIGLALSIFASITSLLLVLINPWFWAATATFVAAAIGISVALGVKIKERNELNRQKKHIENCQAISGQMKTHLQEIYKLGEFFVKYWQGISTQLSECVENLKLLSGDPKSPLGILDGDYKFIERLWRVLAGSLDLYVKEA